MQIRSHDHSPKNIIIRTQSHHFIEGLHDKISLYIVKLLKKKSLVPGNGFVTEV